MSFSVLVLHGPNLSLLADDEIDPRLERRAAELGVELIIRQSNGEQGLLDALHEEAGGVDAVIANPGALAPLAFSLAEGLQQLELRTIEVLLKTPVSERGPSALTGVAQQQVHGLGVDGYLRALDLLMPEGKPLPPKQEEEDEDEDEAPASPKVRGKSIGRKSVTTAPAGAARGKTIGRAAGSPKKESAPSLPKTSLTRAQVRDRIAKRLKGEETAEALAQWARQTWTGLQRGAPVEAAFKETIEGVLLTLMAGTKVSDPMLVAQMAKLEP